MALVALSVLGLWIRATRPVDAHLGNLLDLFNLDAECNIPTWFSSALMLVSAILLFAIGGRDRTVALRWHALGVIFVLMSMDEVAQLHERLGKRIIPVEGIVGPAGFNWVLLAVPFAIAVAIAYLPLLRRLPAGTRWGMIAAGAIFVSGAAGLEAVGGRLVGCSGWGTLSYTIVSQVEETLELVGLYVFARTLWGYLSGLTAA